MFELWCLVPNKMIFQSVRVCFYKWPILVCAELSLLFSVLFCDVLQRMCHLQSSVRLWRQSVVLSGAFCNFAVQIILCSFRWHLDVTAALNWIQWHQSSGWTKCHGRSSGLWLSVAAVQTWWQRERRWSGQELRATMWHTCLHVMLPVTRSTHWGLYYSTRSKW